jgi:hypothetical protein
MSIHNTGWFSKESFAYGKAYLAYKKKTLVVDDTEKA